MATFTTGDTAPDLTGACLNGTVAANITGAAIALHIKWADGSTATKAGTVVSGTAGTWSYSWATGDLVVPGRAEVEVQVTYSNGKIQTFGPEPFAVADQLA